MMDRAAQPLASPYHIIPAADPYFTTWYVNWAYWLTTDGEEGEEPTADVMRLVEIWEELKVAGSDERISELMDELVRIHTDNIWMIGTVGEDISPGVVRNNFRNVPMDLVTDDVLRTPMNGMPAQFFIKQEE